MSETDLLPSPCALCGSRLGVRCASGWVCGICEWPHGERPDDELLAGHRHQVSEPLRSNSATPIDESAMP